MAQWDPFLCRLRQVIVDPAHRGEGVGGQLVKRVLGQAGQEDRDRVRVHALLQSKKFYAKIGFTEIGGQYRSGDKQVVCQKMVYITNIHQPVAHV